MTRLPTTFVVATQITLAACSDSPRPTEVAGANHAASVGATTPVSVYPGTSIQTAVDRAPPGTTFLIKAGVHRRQSVIPKSRDRFIGEPGAILTGENVTAHAFHLGPTAPYPSRVLIKGLILERYNPPLQLGPVSAGGTTPEQRTTGWVVADCEIRYNATAGIRMSHKMKVLRNKIHHNGQIGLSGGQGDSILIEGNEIAFNNFEKRFPHVPGWEEGGAKFATTRWVVVRGNYSHDNWGPGLWTDIGSIYALYENNRVTDNAGPGIFHEISYDAVIRNNVVARNGFDRGWMYGAGILVAHSPNVQLYGNTVRDNKQGIAGIQQDRTDHPFPYGPHLLRNLYVHDNTVMMRTGRTGVGQGDGDNAVFTRNNRFAHNTYFLGTNATPFYWLNAGRTVAQWRGYGHDVNGTFNR